MALVLLDVVMETDDAGLSLVRYIREQLKNDQVRVVLGDTDRGDGFGSAGSRSLFVGGSAVQVGSERTIDKARQLAAAELEASAEDISYSQGVFKVAGTDIALDLFALAARPKNWPQAGSMPGAGPDPHG